VGLFTGLLLLPLAPVRGVAWIAEMVAEEAERELAARESPERALADLEAAHLAGEVSDEEFAERQAELIDLSIAGRGGGGVRL
jgi:Gas vesicle protein G